MSNIVVPSLSTAGFIEDVPSQVDRMMSYYLTSDHSQSNLFNGKVLSLQRQIQAYQHSDMELINNVRDELERYFQDIVDVASVQVTTDTPNPDDPNRINLTVSAILTKDGRNYSLGRLVEIRDSIILKIINLNNEGTAQ